MKIFEKKKFPGGRRRIYFCGIRILSYKCSKHNIVYEYFQKFLSIKDATKYIRSLGVKVGENTRFVVHPHFFSYPDFGSEPFLIEIGNNVLVSFGVTFLTHDGAISTCLNYMENTQDISTFAKIKVGDNTFIGCKSTILRGVTIGDNCVIGAGSVVTKNVPSGEVWAGNPARFIRKTENLAQKMDNLQVSQEQIELKEIARSILGGG